MCGIMCSISLLNHNCDYVSNDKCFQLLKNRGPDDEMKIYFENIMFGGYVLWHQGEEICSQPVELSNSILVFNGDIFNLDSQRNESDTKWLSDTLDKSSEMELLNHLHTINGPFSLIFFNKITKNLYFCRDSLGRNSLLVEQNGSHFRLLSVSHLPNNMSTKIMELPPLGLYKLNINKPNICEVFPWSLPDEFWWNEAKNFENMFGITIQIGQVIGPEWLIIDNEKEDIYNFYELCKVPFSSKEGLYDILLQNSQLRRELDNFSLLLENSVRDRVQKTAKFCSNCILSRKTCHHSKVAILFSGGIDCTILAVLANRYIDKEDSIDLINVAFERNKSTPSNWDVPDRITARSSYKELQELCPLRKWNFIEVNVTREELDMSLDSHIKHLIFPLNKVLDESLGCAFWFASQAKGYVGQCQSTSTARVVIVGTGADELFGGYIRHKNVYMRCAGDKLEKDGVLHAELEKDWKRIPSRNLARDDRIIGDSGKTPRAPFIEEHLVKYVRSLKPSQRCCFILDDGIGDKMFLRIYGYRLGLRTVSFLRKRAIQFGSRIANKKQGADEVSSYLQLI